MPIIHARLSFWHLLVVCALGLSLHSGNLRAEDSADQTEAKEAAEEAEAQRKAEIAKDRPIIEAAEGRLILREIPDPKHPPDVVGTLSTAKGQIYQIKLVSPDVLPALVKANGQNVQLSGNYRNKRKYFLANGVTILGDKGKI